MRGGQNDEDVERRPSLPSLSEKMDPLPTSLLYLLPSLPLAPISGLQERKREKEK